MNKKAPADWRGHKANPVVEMGGISSNPLGNAHFTTGRHPNQNYFLNQRRFIHNAAAPFIGNITNQGNSGKPVLAK